MIRWWVCAVLSILSVTAIPCAHADVYRIAVLDEPAMPVEGCGTPAVTFEKVLANERYAVTRLGARDLADPSTFNAQRFDLLVVATGASFPLDAKAALLAFLQCGGDLLCSGGYAFDKPYVQKDGQWIPYADEWMRQRDLARDTGRASVANGGFEEGTQGWRDSIPGASTVSADSPHAGRACGEVASQAAGGGSWETTLPVTPGGSYLVGAYTKAEGLQGPGFAFLAVYQYDAQGALLRFIDFIQMRQKTTWKRAETLVEVDAKAAQVVFRGGLYLATGKMWIDDVTCAPLPRQEMINTHYGKPEDGLLVSAEQLGVFSPDQRIEGAGLRTAIGVLDAAWRADGPVRGFEATAQLNQNARWTPLLEVYDKWGRYAGCAGARVTHYAGPFTHSNWALFGVDNRDVFAGEEGARLLRDTVRRLAAGVYLRSLCMDAPMHAPGDEASVNFSITSGADAQRQVTVEATLAAPDFQATPLARESQVDEVKKGTFGFSALQWTVPPSGPDYIEAEFRLLVEGEEVDRDRTGLCVRNPQTVRSGSRIRFADNAFTLQRGDGAPRRFCLLGTDTFANMFLSPAQSPTTWRTDLRGMRDYGLNLIENLQFPYSDKGLSETDWLQVDALMQMAQGAGMPYMAGMLIGQNVAVSDESLNRQEAFCRDFATRYKDMPGLIYYLNGDFTLELKDLPDLRRLWNGFLRERHGTDAALRSAWGDSAPRESLGDIPVKEWPAQAWYDPHARDVAGFKVSLTRRWVHALSGAVRSVDSAHPVTSEFYQRPLNGIDLRLAVDDLDVANIGYFDAPKYDTARMMATLKWNDMRWAGKSINVGEFGAKTHDAWAEERGGFHYHIKRSDEELLNLYWWMAHAGWAAGASKVQNWCWSDDPDRVFPWGFTWANPARPKPVLKMFRNLALLSRHVEPTYKPADMVMVMPDAWRTGAPESMAYASIMNAVECLVATNVPFDVVNQGDLAALAARPPRLAIMPFAYAIDDETLNALTRLASTGTVVYLSGDPSIAPDGSRRADRLEALCGARYRVEHLSAAGLPVAEVDAVTAEAVAVRGGASLLERQHGKGAVVWLPEPWEAFAGEDLFVEHPEWTAEPERNPYLSIAERAGLTPPLRLKTSGGVWRAGLMPSGSNRLVSLLPRTPERKDKRIVAKADGIKITLLRPLAWPAAVLVDPDGACLQASGSGALIVNGRRIIDAAGAWTVMGLDGMPLPRARSVLVSSTTGGRIHYRGSGDNMEARLVEWRDGIPQVIAKVPVKKEWQGWSIETEPNELYVVAPAGASVTALLAGLLE